MAQSETFLRFRERYLRAVDGGLVAAAYVYRNAVVERLMHGYTTGDFVTPHVARTVAVSLPFDRNGVRAIAVGTNVNYAAFWELGHFNLFTGRYERVEHWREAVLETKAAQEAAFHRTFDRLLRAS